MATIPLQLTDELEQRAAKAAQALGVSAQAFMADAIQQRVEVVEARSTFVAEAVQARTEMTASGVGHDPRDVRDYLRRRIADNNTPRPEAKAWRK
jgi:predicted transcriptional regulator